jgi:hypothetical protein
MSEKYEDKVWWKCLKEPNLDDKIIADKLNSKLYIPLISVIKFS